MCVFILLAKTPTTSLFSLLLQSKHHFHSCSLHSHHQHRIRFDLFLSAHLLLFICLLSVLHKLCLCLYAQVPQRCNKVEQDIDRFKTRIMIAWIITIIINNKVSALFNATSLLSSLFAWFESRVWYFISLFLFHLYLSLSFVLSIQLTGCVFTFHEKSVSQIVIICLFDIVTHPEAGHNIL